MITAAYADPPYIGQAKRHYANDPKCAEVDHLTLISRLDRDYNAWALSLSSPTLRRLLPLCPDGVRVGAWIKPFCSFKPNVNPAFAWEPLIFKTARKRTREQPTVSDFVSANITLQKGTHGAKPKEFCFWLFEILNLKPGDVFHDLFPGSGAVSDAWDLWCRQFSLELGQPVNNEQPTLLLR
jgi:hypothetical protein